MNTQDRVDAIIQKQGYDDYKWIIPAEIIVSHWVRMKCLYGCNEYGQTATCPPNTDRQSLSILKRKWKNPRIVSPGHERSISSFWSWKRRYSVRVSRRFSFYSWIAATYVKHVKKGRKTAWNPKCPDRPQKHWA